MPDDGFLDALLGARGAAIEVLHARTAVYTAEPVVDGLLGRLDWPRSDRCLVDPSCGDGAFVGRALEKLLAMRPDIAAEDMVRVLEGWEVHPAASSQARHRLTGILHGHGFEEAAAVAARIVRNADFLTEGPRGSGPRYHAIAGNPPYLRYANLPELLRREYLGVVPGNARADLLHSFLARCADLLAADGEIGFVTADRWLFNMGAAALRASLGQSLAIGHLERLDPASAFYRPKLRRAGTPPRIHPVAVVMRPLARGGIRLGAAAIHPGAEGGGIAPPLDGEGTVLGDVATIRLAPWLGSPGIFVVDAATARRLPPECLVPAVDTDDIVDGVLQPPRRFAIRTLTGEEPPAEVLAHLDAHLERMAKRGRRTPRWLPPETFHGLDLSQPALLIPRIARSLAPVRLPPGILPINHNLTIVGGRQADIGEIETRMRGEGAQAWMRTYAARLESNYFSITTTLLRSFPWRAE